MAEKKYVIDNPALMAEWNREKNLQFDFSPQILTLGSDKKVWWTCNNSHEWEASISSRNSGNGCPYCSGRYPIKGKNDLQTINPSLAREWNYPKNNELTPIDVLPNSGKKVWWKCDKGHEWQAQIIQRNKGVGCPYCSGRYAIKGENDLETVNPILAQEWNYELNGTLKPCDVLPNSDKKIWWKCNKGHEWQALISNRNKGIGCPYCSGRYPIKGKTDLQTVNPSLAREWNYPKNNELTPTDVLPNCDKKVWWKCDKGHEWQATIGHRNSGNGCPYCSGRYPIKGENDLQTINPSLAKEWNYAKNKGLTPIDVLPNSSKKVWWVCDKKHNWQSKICERTKGHGCPYCLGRYPIKGKNDLQTVNPSLAYEWNYPKNKGLTPIDVLSNSGRKVWWKCNKGHEWQALISNRNKGIGCPYCSGRYPIKGKTDLQTVNPRVAQEWNYSKNNGLTPVEVLPNSDKKVWWKCRKGHEWKTTISNRHNGNGCPICSSERRTSFPEYAFVYYLKKHDLDVIHSYKENGYELDIYIPSKKIAIEYDGYFWHKNKEKKDLEKNFKCKRDGIKLYRIREGLMPLNDSSIDYITQINQKDFSIICKLVLSEIIGMTVDVDLKRDAIAIENLLIHTEKENSLSIINPQMSQEWNYALNKDLRPEYFSVNSNKKVWWKCQKGHEWQAKISHRNLGSGCPYCSGLYVIKGVNDLETVNPSLLVEWDYAKNEFIPAEVLPYSKKKAWWKCQKGHEWQATIYNRAKGQHCPYCTNKKVLKGYNDLATTNPNLAKEWNYDKNGELTPYQFSAGAVKKVWWICTKGHEWQAKIYSRMQGKGCPYCSKRRKPTLKN